MRALAAAALLLALPRTAASAPTAKLVGKLVAPERLPGDRFGAAVAVDGQRGVVGSPDGDVGIHDRSGRLHALALGPDGWAVVGDIDPSAGSSPERRLGADAAIAGTTAVFGAPGYFNGGTTAGAVYIYSETQPNVWTAAALLAPPLPFEDDDLGLVVGFGPGRVIAARSNSTPPGRAYGYVEQTPGVWSTMPQQLEAPDPAPGDRFGLAIAVDGDQALIGAPGADVGRGAAYLFQWTDNGWISVTKLVSSDRKPDDRFGAAVALEGTTALIGAPGRGKDTGVAWAFEHDGDAWVQSPPLTPSGLTAKSRYGGELALALPYAVVTAVDHGLDPNQPDLAGTGRATWFGRAPGGAWIELATIEANDGVPGDRLGSSVALAGDQALLGAPGDDDDLGAVYVFRLEQLGGAPCIGDPECQEGLCCDGLCAAACEPATGSDGSSGDVTSGATEPTGGPSSAPPLGLDPAAGGGAPCIGDPECQEGLCCDGLCADACEPVTGSDGSSGDVTSGATEPTGGPSSAPPLGLDPAAGGGCSCSSRDVIAAGPWSFLVLAALVRPRRRLRGRGRSV